MSRIGVIIPYFQRKPGILKACLESIAAQDTTSELTVVVVDDESPVPADTEAQQIPPFQGSIVIKRQQNAGPGAARNTGLQMLAGNVDTIAFLDSDDTWSPEHLSRAERALNAGADFYFCNYTWPGPSVSQFERCGFLDQLGKQTRRDVDLFEHSTDFVDTVLRYHIGTGTVAYKADRFGDLRFRTDFRYAHEDTLFWLDVAVTSTHIAFSDKCSMFLGTGVNIFSSAGWGAPQELERLRDEVGFCNYVMQNYRISDDQRNYLVERLAGARTAAMPTILHQAVRGMLDRKSVFRYLRVDPVAPLRILPVLIRVLAKRVGIRSPLL